MPTFIKAITEFSNQLYPVTPQPFSAAVNYLYLVVGCGFFFFMLDCTVVFS